MSPELNKAISERRKLGYNENQIKQELVEAGYDDESIGLVLSQFGEGTHQAVPLPGVLVLINNALDFVKSRYDLALVLAAPLVLLSLMNYLMDAEIISGGALLLVGVLGLLSLVAYFYLTLAVLYTISHHEDREIIFKEALDWSKRNIFKYAWLAFLSALVVWGGFILLIIPGVIFSIYLYLSQYVLTIEGKTGFAAITRSQQLISGAWWSLFSRLVGVAFLFVLFFVVLGVIFTLATGSLAESAISLFLIDVILQLFTALVTVCSFHIGTQIYHNRVIQVQTKEPLKPKYVLYGGMVIAGLLFIFGLIGAVIMYGDDIEKWANEATINAEIEQSRESAKQRAEELRDQKTTPE